MRVRELKDFLESLDPEMEIEVSTYSCGSVSYSSLSQSDLFVDENTLVIDAEVN